MNWFGGHATLSLLQSRTELLGIQTEDIRESESRPGQLRQMACVRPCSTGSPVLTGVQADNRHSIDNC